MSKITESSVSLERETIRYLYIFLFPSLLSRSKTPDFLLTLDYTRLHACFTDDEKKKMLGVMHIENHLGFTQKTMLRKFLSQIIKLTYLLKI